MTEAAVSVQNISKLYLLYNKPQDRLKQSILGRLGKNYAHTFWALRNVSFQVNRSEMLGIIGRNGSGKSTLLQVIAGTLQPTEGTLTVNGRLTALLELGAGFNPEFTGRENIYLNGATLGIPEKEMRIRAEEIIDFAQIGEFIDQPVKIYSSGMYVRLAFAIATSVDPDVLLIDEALAVGDLGFVIKCMDRIKQMRSRGATVLLVTHDLQSVRSLCDKALWLKDGHPECFGDTNGVTSSYLRDLITSDSTHLIEKALGDPTGSNPTLTVEDEIDKETETQENQGTQSQRSIQWGSGGFSIIKFTVDNGSPNGNLYEYGGKIRVHLNVEVTQENNSNAIGFGVAFRNNKGLDIITSTTYDQGHRFPPLRRGQRIQVEFELDNFLAYGDYAVVINIEDRSQAVPQYYIFLENALFIHVITPFPIYSLLLPPVKQTITLENLD